MGTPPLVAPILAKRPQVLGRPQQGETLVGHSHAVLTAWMTMFGGSSRLSERWMTFFGLDPDVTVGAFAKNGLVACGLHDWGKDNTGFQDALRGEHNAQMLRHEHLSGVFLLWPQLRDWLCNIPLLDFPVILAAVVGHHLKANSEEFCAPLHTDRKLFNVEVEPLRDILAILSGPLGSIIPDLSGFPESWAMYPRPGYEDVETLAEAVKGELHRLSRDLRKNTLRRALLLAVRSSLIAADAVGSGLVRTGGQIQEWIEDAFDPGKILSGIDVQNKVITPRVRQLSTRGPFVWNDFQVAAESLPERALLLAPCGSGKTLAAWRWIKAQAAKRPAARVLFLYPTRATATEGFRDYISWAPEADAALVSGTSAYELVGMFTNPEDDRSNRDYTTEDRLFALGYWQRRIFSATVDQFLGFMQHAYRSTCLIPVLADSIVVVDEVHSFDRALFSAFRHFLSAFPVPVLCMTASLPSRRRTDLVNCGLHVWPESGTGQFADLARKAEMPRYRVQVLAGEEVAVQKTQQALLGDRRVLWVVNTVHRCQRIARLLGGLCYHSRFRLVDRNRRHREVLSSFQPGKPSVLAVTTQVCEMSLDLDADVLVSEAAPVSSLIQRMGRCNRHTGPGDGRPAGKVFLYPPEDDLPYSSEDLKGVQGMLTALENRTVSQADLVEVLEEYGPTTLEVEKVAMFLDSGPWAKAREESLREGMDFTDQAILETDVEQYLSLKRRGDYRADGLVLAVPRKHAKLDTRLGRWLKVAESNRYDPDYGYVG